MVDGTASLRLPALRTYVGVARLTLAGIVSRLGFDVDAAEDVKLAVAEAMNLLLRGRDGAPGEALAIECRWSADALEIEVSGGAAAEPPEDDSEQAVAVMVMAAVMDDVECADLAGLSPRVRLRCLRPAR